mmetsp:Transcript_58259/g.189919  ORF Transcript_58259/g.189919 Transcript_58259/m.189919 type:complete len:81 (+) Transcript_58259:1549-1791(+)
MEKCEKEAPGGPDRDAEEPEAMAVGACPAGGGAEGSACGQEEEEEEAPWPGPGAAPSAEEVAPMNSPTRGQQAGEHGVDG